MQYKIWYNRIIKRRKNGNDEEKKENQEMGLYLH